MKNQWRKFLSALMLSTLLGSPAFAQSEGPAVDTSPRGQQTPPSGEQEPAVSPRVGSGDGTSIIGDTEAPIGLYIIPWRASSPTPQIDRPARFLDAAEEPVDETQFRRFVHYHEALRRHRESQ